MSVFGNVWGSTSGVTVDKYDVRYGVAASNGTGTLTLPAPAQVSAGVQYGGDGDQFTGTLRTSRVPAPTDDWTGDMAEVFGESVVEWGDVLSFGGFEIECVKTALTVSYEFELAGVTRSVDTAIDVMRAEAIRIGLYLPEWKNNPPSKRPVVLVSGVRFAVVSWEDDILADPTIKMKCAKLQ